jgi:putative FmdB family regulatory protein
VPTYSYRCANCDFAFEQYQAFTDDSLTICPNCGQPQLRKVFNDIGVSFKGSGFYRTDSRAKPAGSKPGHHKSGSEKSGPDKTSPDKAGSSSTGSGDSSAKPKSDKTPTAKPAASSASGSSGKSGSTSS